MKIKKNIKNIPSELNKIGSSRGAKDAKTETPQNTFIDLQKKVIENHEEYINKLETLIKEASAEK